MSSLIRRQRQEAEMLASRDRSLEAALARAQRPALIATTRLQAGAIAASVGIQGVCMVSQAADAAFRISPLAENEYRGIVAAYGNFARGEVERLVLHDGES